MLIPLRRVVRQPAPMDISQTNTIVLAFPCVLTILTNMGNGEYAVIRVLLIDLQIPRPIEHALTIAREVP